MDMIQPGTRTMHMRHTGGGWRMAPPRLQAVAHHTARHPLAARQQFSRLCCMHAVAATSGHAAVHPTLCELCCTPNAPPGWDRRGLTCAVCTLSTWRTLLRDTFAPLLQWPRAGGAARRGRRARGPQVVASVAGIVGGPTAQ